MDQRLEPKRANPRLDPSDLLRVAAELESPDQMQAFGAAFGDFAALIG